MYPAVPIIYSVSLSARLTDCLPCSLSGTIRLISIRYAFRPKSDIDKYTAESRPPQMRPRSYNNALATCTDDERSRLYSLGDGARFFWTRGPRYWRSRQHCHFSCKVTFPLSFSQSINHILLWPNQQTASSRTTKREGTVKT